MNAVFNHAASSLPWYVPAALAAGAAGAAAWLFITTYRYIRTPKDARPVFRAVYRARFTWRRVAMNTGLMITDETTKGKVDANGKRRKPQVKYPNARFYAKPYGLLVHARTLPKIGFDEYDKASSWLADAWGCDTVEVEQISPKVIELRGLMRDPLAHHEPLELPTGQPKSWTLPLGVNPWGRHLEIPLKDLSGVKVAGLPGFGKTMLMLSWYARFAATDLVQFCAFDGKTADARYGDWGQVANRMMFVVGDNPEAANAKLTDLVRLIKNRPAQLVAERGTHRFWKHGPTRDNPLVLVLMDECHNYSDVKGLRGHAKEIVENNQRLMQTISKEGRGTGVIGIFGTQKQTGDAIPTAVRDNLEVGISFAVTTLDAAEAALGSEIRKDAHDAQQPTKLRGDKEANKGVCVVTGIPKIATFDRLRVGDVDEDRLVKHIQTYAPNRIDVIPAPAPTVRDVSATEAGTDEGGASRTVPMQKKTTRRKTA